MKIRKDDYQNILEYLVKKRWEGEELVAFPDNPYPVSQEDLSTFQSMNEAQGFCHAMSTDTDVYGYLAIRSAYRTMSEAVKDGSLMIESGGIVHVSSMVALRYKRLETEQLLNNKNSIIMNQKNFEYLRDQVKYTGFGESLEKELKGNLEKPAPEFTLFHNGKFEDDITTSALHFKKSMQSDMYFFNSYKMSLKKDNKPDIMEQTFYINKGNNITMKEAYNLMKGRAVNKDLTNKEGQLYNAWIQMDFKQTDKNGNYKLKQYHQNYGFDLDSALARHPIKELSHDEYKANLMASLKKGNRQSVTFLQDGTEQRQYIEANPRFKTINIYDSNMQRLGNRQSKKEKQAEGESKTVKQDARKEKQITEDDGPEIPKAAKKKRKKKAQSVS